MAKQTQLSFSRLFDHMFLIKYQRAPVIRIKQLSKSDKVISREVLVAENHRQDIFSNLADISFNHRKMFDPSDVLCSKGSDNNISSY